MVQSFSSGKDPSSAAQGGGKTGNWAESRIAQQLECKCNLYRVDRGV